MSTSTTFDYPNAAADGTQAATLALEISPEFARGILATLEAESDTPRYVEAFRSVVNGAAR